MTAYLRPRDLDEARAARAAHPDWMVLAGGTDLMVNANHRAAPAGILDLWRLAELCFVRHADGEISIGAGTTWLEVERDPAVQAHLAPLAAAAREIGALQIQARATLGGNVGTSSPVGDSLPVLLALDAALEVASPRGRRLAAAARAAVVVAIYPIDDVRSTASNRREVAANLVARFFGTRTRWPSRRDIPVGRRPARRSRSIHPERSAPNPVCRQRCQLG